MAKGPLHPRYLGERVHEALEDSPAVLIHGPRQCGKTTLARLTGDEKGYDYFTFDDPGLVAAATEDPRGFVDRLPARVILDEVQRVPRLFVSLKQVIDHDRSSGRFILTGSANVLLVPRLSDSLAGRMEILTLLPLAQCELRASPPCLLDELLAGTVKMRHSGRTGDALAELIMTGGYPEPNRRSSWQRRRAWHRSYLDTIVQRDVREMTQLRNVEDLSRLLEISADRTANLFNASSLAAPFSLSRPTIASYVAILKRLFLITLLPAWHSSRSRRMTRTPKLHLADPGLASSLMGLTPARLVADRALFGKLLETFVHAELKRHASWHPSRPTLHHFRDRDGYEVDVVIVGDGGEISGIEVKAASTVERKDFRGLRRLRREAGKAFRSGVVLYDGDHLLSFGNALFAAPLSALWS